MKKGFKVALVEQLEDPKKVKRLVKRDVVRVITPGTVVEDALLKSKSDNYLAAISFEPAVSAATRHVPPSFGLALIDLSTGEFATTQIEGEDAQSKLFDELERVQPSEYVLPTTLAENDAFVAQLTAIRPSRISPLDDHAFSEAKARRLLQEQFRVRTLHAFGCEELPLAIGAAGAALHYLKENQPASAAGSDADTGRGRFNISTTSGPIRLTRT